jgi:wyosine [tRNA(Phe)-imidazoG37] synthetase (radical SAM superfamily)
MRIEKPTGFKHIFGPVPSRRLGMSLGVDMMPHKTCTLDCVYCESGATTCLTLTPDEYVPGDRIKAELREFLSGNPPLDHITFSGSGEPMLHNGIGEIIRFVKTAYPEYKVAVLTNGTLLYHSELKKQILDVDVLKVSLDAASEKIFTKINRPCDGLKLAHIIDGLRALREDFPHQFWVEVFLVPGLNDTPEELERIRDVLIELNPHRVQLNTLDRPGTEAWVTAVSRGELERIAAYLLDAEIIKHFDSVDADKTGHLDENKRARVVGKNQQDSVFVRDVGDRILSTIKRRPCTVDDMARQLNLEADELYPYLEDFLNRGKIIRKEMPRGAFYGLRM